LKPLVVVCDGLDEDLFKNLSRHPSVNVHPSSKVKPAELQKLLPTAEALIIRSSTNPNREMIDQAPNLKLIIRAGEGTDNIDKIYCQKKGIKVANTPGANNNSAAEHAIALMMTVLRKTAQANLSMQKGEWEKNLFTGSELTGKTVGIVGFGRIGQLVAKRLSGFEPNILFYDPFISQTEIPNCRLEKDLNKLFIAADIITIHTPLMDSTKNLVNASLLKQMKKTAILINAARGGIVNEDDLLSVLKNKLIRGAALDVFSKEPLIDNSPLRQLDNLVLTPHLGASTEEAQKRVGEMAVHQVIQFFDHNNLLNEVKV
jgi:D-3-phosphoglycerate dehydrogenase